MRRGTGNRKNEELWKAGKVDVNELVPKLLEGLVQAGVWRAKGWNRDFK